MGVLVRAGGDINELVVGVDLLSWVGLALLSYQVRFQVFDLRVYCRVESVIQQGVVG